MLKDYASLLKDDLEVQLASARLVMGHLTGVDDEGRLVFRPEGANETYPVAIGVTLSDDELVNAASLSRRALVLTGGDDQPQRVLVGLLRERVGTASREAFHNGIKVRVDGEDVRLQGKSEIELRCGKARILLRKSGYIELSGTCIVSRSRGPVKVKGATIALN
jgi:hypothetical protein